MEAKQQEFNKKKNKAAQIQQSDWHLGKANSNAKSQSTLQITHSVNTGHLRSNSDSR